MPFLRDQQVTLGRRLSLLEEAAYSNEAFMDHEATNSSSLTGKSGLYMKRDEMPHMPGRTYGSRRDDRSMSLSDMLPILMLPESQPKISWLSVTSNGKTAEKSVSFADEKKNKVKQSMLGEHHPVGILMPTSQQERQDENRNAGNSCEAKVSSGPREKGTPKVVDIPNRADSSVDVLMAAFKQASFSTPEGRAQERQEAEKAEADCVAKALSGQKPVRRLDNDDSSEENPYRSMHSVFCVDDDEETTTDDELMGNGRPRFRKKKNMQTVELSGCDQEITKPN